MTLAQLLYFINLASKWGKYRLAIKLTEKAIQLTNF